MKKLASILVPVYNEQNSILGVLNKLNEVFNNKYEYEIIVINDCSTDSTKQILEENSNLYTVLINNNTNLGKGGSVKKGLELSNGTYIFFQDADNEYDPKDFENFFYVIENFKPDCIIGSRFKFTNYIRSHYFFNKIGNFIITNLFNLIYNTTFTDIYSCYFVFKRELIDFNKLKTSGFEQQAEILARVVKSGKKFYEVPINYNGRTFEEGKKIKFKDFFKVIYQILIMKFS
jgi:glycosyltransferase involved in cell wall biosynthesis